MGLEIAICSSVLSLEGKGQVGDEMEQSEGDDIDQKVDHRAYLQSRLTTQWSSASQIFKHYKCLFKYLCFWLTREGGCKTKLTKLIASGIWSTWVQLEIVNPSPSPTHLAGEREWAKAEVVLNVATRFSRETELIR
ncbi:hypothetical protein H5410_061166, partial [Solanum commersonii]